MAKTKAVTAKAATNGSLTTIQEEFDVDHKESGLENVTPQDVLIPRIMIVQPTSYQIIKSHADYIEEAEAGDFCDIGLKQIFKEEIHILPCYFRKSWIEWGASLSDGLQAIHYDSDILKECEQNERFKFILPNGHVIRETAEWYCVNLTAGNRNSFIPLSGTQLKPSRALMTAITNEKIQRADKSEITPPIWYRTYKATPVPTSNDEGNWFLWSFKPDQTVLEYDPSKELLNRAKSYYNSIRHGEVTGDINSNINNDEDRQSQSINM